MDTDEIIETLKYVNILLAMTGHSTNKISESLQYAIKNIKENDILKEELSKYKNKGRG